MRIILITLLMAISVSAADVTVGVINIQKVISKIKEGKEVQATLEKSFKAKQKEIKAEEGKIKELQEKYQKQSALLSDEAKLKKEQEIRAKIAGLQKKTMGYQKEIQKQEAQLKKPILEKLKPIIDEVSEGSGVSMTFEVSSSPIVYAKNQVDITDKVIKAYDKKHK
jgi:outer membrane protein